MTREGASGVARGIAGDLDCPAWIHRYGSGVQVVCGQWDSVTRYWPQIVGEIVAVVLPDGREFTLAGAGAQTMSREEYVGTVDGEWG